MCIKKVSKNFLVSFVIALIFLNPIQSSAQCDSITPSFNVNLSSSPNITWVSSAVKRDGSCCGSTGSSVCIKFEVTLHPNAAGILFDIASGALPTGSMYYQLGCSTPTTVGQPLCLSGAGPHIITFCKPGNNINTYSIKSFPKPTSSSNIVVNDGCTGIMGTHGYEINTINWTSIYPGATGAYNSYLSCTTACDTVNVTAAAGYPPYVDYQVCGIPMGACDTTLTCDTIRVFFSSTLDVQILPITPTLCIGDTSVTLTANGIGGTPPYSFTWSTASTSSSIHADTGIYIVEVVDSSGCPGTSDTVEVTAFSSAISADAGPDQFICDQNNTITLSGNVTAASGGSWSNGAGSYVPSSDSLNTNYIATAAEIAAGQLQFVLTTTGNGSCPAEQDTMLVKYTSFDAIPVLNKTDVQCKGMNNGEAYISISGGKAPFTYYWNTVPPSTNDSVSMISPGNYSVSITDSLGCDSIIYFTISEPDSISIQSALQDADCFGSATASVNLTVSGGVSPYNFQWSNGTTNQNLSPVIAGSYSVTITDSNLCDTSLSYTLNQPTILAVSHTKQDVTCNNGNDGSIDITVSGGTSPYSYVWSDGSITEDLNGLSAGTYTVTVTDNNNCDSTISVIINQPPPVVASVSGNASICSGSTSTLTASGANTYSWSPSIGLNSNSVSIVTASPTSSQTYTVIATDSIGCKDTVLFNLTVLNNPNVIVNPINASMCLGEAKTLSSSGANSYLWSPSNGLNTTTSATVIANPTTSTTYTLVGTATNGCTDTVIIPITINNPPIVSAMAASSNICYGDSTLVNASGASSYSWFPTSYASGSTGSSISVFPPSSTTYSVIGTDANGCMDTATVPITVNPLPTMSMTPTSSVICIGDTTTLSASGAFTYSWTPGANITPTTGASISAFPTSTTVYTVLGTDTNGCQDTAMATVYVNPLPIVNITPDQDTICVKDSIQLTASGGLIYQWTPSSSLSTSIGSTVMAGPSTSTSYIVTASDINNCINSDTAIINVLPQPVVTATAASSSICINDSTLLTASGASTYNWYPNTNISNTSGTPTSVFPATSTTYHVIGADANGCMDTAHIPITVNPLPIMSMTPTSSVICIGDTTTLSASGAFTYSWTPGANITPTTGASISAFPTSTTVYTVLGTDTNGCQDTAMATVNVNPLPIVNITPDQDTICVKDSIQLTASGGLIYQWTPSSSLSTSIGSTVMAGPSTSTSYIVTASDINNCINSDTAIINVLPQPVVTATAASSSICINDSTLLTASGASTYNWYPNTNISNTSGTPTSVFPATSTTYHVIGADANGCMDTAHIPITVNPLPIMSMTPTSSVICIGDTTTLSASGAFTYSWTPGSNITPTTGASISAFPTSTTVYTVLGTDTNGCQDTAMATVNVNPLPIVNITPDQDTICVKDSIQLTASGGLIYQWTPSSSLSTSIGSTVMAGPSTSTSYIVTASDINNCINSDTAIINVLPQPVVTATAANSSICINDSTLLTASGASTYNWYPNTNISNTSGTPTSVFPATSTTFHVIGADANGCMDTAHIPITVNPLPIMSMTPTSSVICIGDTTTLSASGAFTYSWTPGSNITPTTGASISAFPTSTTVYTVLGTDTNGCQDTAMATVNVNPLPIVNITPSQDTICDFDTVTLTATGGVNYSWSPSSSLSSTNGSTNNAFPSSSTVYTVTATDINNCSNTATASIFVVSLPNIQINPKNTGICYGDSIQLLINSNQNIVTYSWSTGQSCNPLIVSPSSTATYIGTGYNAFGCKNSDTSTVKVNHIPTVELSATSPICNNDTSSITFTTSAKLPYQISFNYDGGNLCSGSGTGPYLVNWANIGTKNVRLTITKDNCSSIEESEIVIVNPSPVAEFISDSFPSCVNVDLQMFNLSGDSTLNSLWDFGDPNSSNNTSTLYSPRHTYSKPGFYTVKLIVENRFGCMDSISKPWQLQIHANPVADFKYRPSDIEIDNPVVDFEDLSDIGDYWNWNFGDSITGIYNFSNDQNPYHIYVDTGYYNVCMDVTTNIGCADTICKLIYVGYPPTIYVPTAFTPDNDNINDVFIPKGNGYDWNTYEMYIFNRWGDVIFKTRDIYQGWDGRDIRKNEICPLGVYVCLLRVKDKNGKLVEIVESVVLYR